MKINNLIYLLLLTFSLVFFTACEVCTICTSVDNDTGTVISETNQFCGTETDVSSFENTEEISASSINATATCIRE